MTRVLRLRGMDMGFAVRWNGKERIAKRGYSKSRRALFAGEGVDGTAKSCSKTFLQGLKPIEIMHPNVGALRGSG
jgi:hypothetical protein